MAYKWHRRMAITSSAFFLLWALSGISMSLPHFSNSSSGHSSNIGPDYSTATLSPSQALNKLETIIGEIPQVRTIQLDKILDVIVYQMVLKNGQTHLVNAGTGEEITIDASLSTQIAKSHGPDNSEVKSTEYVTKHSLDYPWGPLPAYSISFNDSGKTIAHVSVVSGAITQSHWLQRIKRTFDMVHDFGLLGYSGQINKVRKILLTLVSLVGIGAICTGIFIFVRQPRR